MSQFFSRQKLRFQGLQRLSTMGHCIRFTSHHRKWPRYSHFPTILIPGNEFQELLKLGHHYLDITQVREDVPDLARWYRHQSKGAWPFSTRDHGWPISGKKKFWREKLIG